MKAPAAGRRAYLAALGLAWVNGSGCHGVLRLLREEGPDAVWGASTAHLQARGVTARAATGFDQKRRSFRPEEAERTLAAAGLRFVPYGSRLYPEELGHLEHPPAGLFVRASDEALERLPAVPRVTIVGTRKATAYGLRATDAFTAAFVARGVAVVSGLAMGIDGRAHQAALDAKGFTVAVLGCGADIVYPPRHRSLYEGVARRGVVLSELPPGAAPAPWTFPHRNRLLAALGDAVVVVEASHTSGALQTASWALDLGRPVFSVPGPIFGEGHQGCNRLLYDGAGAAVEPAVTVEDFLLQTRIERGRRQAGEGRRAESGDGVPAGLGDRGEPRQARVLDALACGPSSVDQLMRRTGLSARELAVALAGLELAGLASRAGPGIYIRAP